MDGLIDLIIDFFLELFVWEQMNNCLRKKIQNRPLRWIVVSLIYLTILMVLLLVLYGIYHLIKITT